MVPPKHQIAPNSPIRKQSDQSSRNKLWRNIAITVISLALAITGAIFSPVWLSAASLTVIAGSLLTLLANLATVPPPYRRLRTRMRDAHQKAIRHPILSRHFNDGVSSLAYQLDSIAAGHFSFPIWQVPELSVFAMNLVNKKCTLTFPLKNSEALLTPDFGTAADYYHAMVAASQRMRAAGLEGVTRIFLLRTTDDISPNILQFIRKNLSDKIVVRIILEDELPPQPIEVEELDFGFYETTDGHQWIMLLRTADAAHVESVTDYAVDTDPQKLLHYKRFSEDIIKRSRTYDEFIRFLIKPVNADLWPAYFAQRGFEMSPPHGVSDEDADYIVDSVLRSISGREQPTILILGFTPKLIRRFLSQPLGSIDSFDQFQSKPPEFASHKRITFHTSNWLELHSDKKYDAVVFDEALNNLSRLQLNLFFPKMGDILKPGGRLIGRVMGRFDDEVTRRYSDKTAWQAVEDLRNITGASHEDFAPLIICLLHSRHLAFSPNSSSVECKKWNTTMFGLKEEGRISDTEYKLWKLMFDFTLLSPDLNTLLAESKQSSFSPLEIRAVRGGYVDKWKDSSQFYRIVHFEFKPSE